MLILRFESRFDQSPESYTAKEPEAIHRKIMNPFRVKTKKNAANNSIHGGEDEKKFVV
jgi:hypothetical protein